MRSVLQSEHPVELRDLIPQVPVGLGKVVHAGCSTEWEISQFLSSQDFDHYFRMYQVWKCLLHTSRKQSPNIGGRGGREVKQETSVFVCATGRLALKNSVRRRDCQRNFLFTRMIWRAYVNLNVSLFLFSNIFVLIWLIPLFCTPYGNPVFLFLVCGCGFFVLLVFGFFFLI